MLNHQTIHPLDDNATDYISLQVNELLRKGHCSVIKDKDYQLEAGAAAVNGLIDEHQTADIYLYAAIERQDWQAALHIYQRVFRPHLYEYALKAVVMALRK